MTELQIILWLQIQPYTWCSHSCPAKAFVHILFSELVTILQPPRELHHSWQTREVLLLPAWMAASVKIARKQEETEAKQMACHSSYGKPMEFPPHPWSLQAPHRSTMQTWTSSSMQLLPDPPRPWPSSMFRPLASKDAIILTRERILSSALQNYVPPEVSLPKAKHQKIAGLSWDIPEAKRNIKVQFCGDLLDVLPPAKPQQDTDSEIQNYLFLRQFLWRLSLSGEVLALFK